MLLHLPWMCEKAFFNRLVEKDRKPVAGYLNVFEPTGSQCLKRKNMKTTISYPQPQRPPHIDEQV